MVVLNGLAMWMDAEGSYQQLAVGHQTEAES
jgi:hypothetical protein